MKKRLLSTVLLAVLLLTSCSSTKSLDQAYIHALEALLDEQDFEYDIDYISFFINDPSISDRDIDQIRKHFKQTYDKNIYTYTPEEVTHAGPYGKENLHMDGMFLYLLEIEYESDEMIVETAKFHTVSERGALGMEVRLERYNHQWHVQQEDILWRE